MRRSPPRSSLVLVVLIAPVWLSQRVWAQAGPEDEPLPPAFTAPGNAPAATVPAPAQPSPPPASVPPASVPPAPLVQARPDDEAPPAAAPVADSFLPSLVGPIGLYHLSTAEVGPVDHFRLALHGQFACYGTSLTLATRHLRWI